MQQVKDYLFSAKKRVELYLRGADEPLSDNDLHTMQKYVRGSFEETEKLLQQKHELQGKPCGEAALAAVRPYIWKFEPQFMARYASLSVRLHINDLEPRDVKGSLDSKPLVEMTAVDWGNLAYIALYARDEAARIEARKELDARRHGMVSTEQSQPFQ